MLVTRPRSIFAHVGRLLITELLPILIWPIFTRFLSPIRLPTLLPTLLPMPLPTFGRLGSVLAMPLSIPGLTVLGRVEGFSGLSIPRKSPRSPADGRPPPPPGRIGRPPAPGRLTLGSLVFGWFAVPPSPGMLGRVAGLGNLLPKPITCPGKLFPGRVVGRVLGREGSAVGGEGRVDGFKPPDGRLTCGWFGVVDRVVGRFTAGRLTFGAVMFGRVGVGLLGAGDSVRGDSVRACRLPGWEHWAAPPDERHRRQCCEQRLLLHHHRLENRELKVLRETVQASP